MSYEGSMMGSGIYSTEVTLEIACEEYCDHEDQPPCKSVVDQDFVTDDWGNIDQEITCEECKHKYRIRKEAQNV